MSERYENVEAERGEVETAVARGGWPRPIAQAEMNGVTVMVFPNGTAMYFDANGKQVSEYQGNAADVILRLAASRPTTAPDE